MLSAVQPADIYFCPRIEGSLALHDGLERSKTIFAASFCIAITSIDGHFGMTGKGIRRAFAFLQPETLIMPKDIFRVVTRGADGKIRIRDFSQPDTIQRLHTQIGIDDCSTDLGLRGMPVFRGLVGPIPEGKNIVRYESPEVFESITKEWSQTKTTRRRRMSKPNAMVENMAREEAE